VQAAIAIPNARENGTMIQPNNADVKERREERNVVWPLRFELFQKVAGNVFWTYDIEDQKSDRY
jgi:hypothetical protein